MLTVAFLAFGVWLVWIFAGYLAEVTIYRRAAAAVKMATSAGYKVVPFPPDRKFFRGTWFVFIGSTTAVVNATVKIYANASVVPDELVALEEVLWPGLPFHVADGTVYILLVAWVLLMLRSGWMLWKTPARVDWVGFDYNNPGNRPKPPSVPATNHLRRVK